LRTLIREGASQYVCWAQECGLKRKPKSCNRIFSDELSDHVFLGHLGRMKGDPVPMEQKDNSEIKLFTGSDEIEALQERAEYLRSEIAGIVAKRREKICAP
jgi:hypothetical protein